VGDPEIQIVPYFRKISFSGFGFGRTPATRIESLVKIEVTQALPRIVTLEGIQKVTVYMGCRAPTPTQWLQSLDLPLPKKRLALRSHNSGIKYKGQVYLLILRSAPQTEIYPNYNVLFRCRPYQLLAKFAFMLSSVAYEIPRKCACS
jgi:hypothetical protein